MHAEILLTARLVIFIYFIDEPDTLFNIIAYFCYMTWPWKPCVNNFFFIQEIKVQFFVENLHWLNQWLQILNGKKLVICMQCIVINGNTN